MQINTIYKHGSTGRTCWETEKMLEANGHQSLTICQRGEITDKKHAYVVNSKTGYYAHKFMARLTGLDGYYSYIATKRAIGKIKDFAPDIIHLRNLHGGYLHLPSLFRFLSGYGKPVVYNIHDTWAYTGKCAVYEMAQCEKWKTECRNCPQWREYPVSWFFDQSNKMFHDKQRWYSAISDLTVVGVSDYIKTQCSLSPLFRKRRIERIYNWIDLRVFRPFDDETRATTRKKYGLGDEFLVVGVSSYWKKNGEYNQICELAKGLGDEAQCVALFSSLAMGRVLGVEGLGEYTFLITFSSIVYIPLNFGLGGILQRNIAQDSTAAEKNYANTLAIRLLFSIPLSLIIGTIFSLFTHRETELSLVLLACLYSGFIGIFLLALSGFTAKENFQVSFLFGMLQKILCLLATCITLYFTQNLTVMLIGHDFILLVLVLFVLYRVNQEICTIRLEFDLLFIKKTATGSLSDRLRGSGSICKFKK